MSTIEMAAGGESGMTEFERDLLAAARAVVESVEAVTSKRSAWDESHQRLAAAVDAYGPAAEDEPGDVPEPGDVAVGDV